MCIHSTCIYNIIYIYIYTCLHTRAYLHDDWRLRSTCLKENKKRKVRKWNLPGLSELFRETMSPLATILPWHTRHHENLEYIPMVEDGHQSIKHRSSVPFTRIPTVDDQRPHLFPCIPCGLVVKVIQLFKETASSRSMTTFWLIPGHDHHAR